MTKGKTASAVGACLGLGGFAVAIVAGLSADNPVNDILMRAVVATLLCAAAGNVLGWLGERAIMEHLRRIAAAHEAATKTTEATK